MSPYLSELVGTKRYRALKIHVASVKLQLYTVTNICYSYVGLSEMWPNFKITRSLRFWGCAMECNGTPLLLRA